MADQNKIYDLAVVGGGVAGAGVARDAALRGLVTVLFEKKTFGSGTSSASSKLIHGGMRYLEVAWKAALKGNFGEAWKNFRFVFRSLGEARTLERISGGIVTPLSLFIPIYASDRRGKWQVIAGTLLYGALGMLAGGLKAPRVFWTSGSALAFMPEIAREGLLGGVLIWDRTTDDRALVIATAGSARRNGAEILEGAELMSYRFDAANRLFELRVKHNGPESVYLARCLVNASGPWADTVRERGGERDKDFIVPVAGSHIELAPFTRHSALLQAVDGRFFFVINTGGAARVGTTERVHRDPDDVTATGPEIDYLLGSLRRYFPGRKFERRDVLRSDAGIRPLAVPPRATRENEISREHEIRKSPSGMLNLLGVKLTDHRRAAEETVDRVMREMGKSCPSCASRKSRTAWTPLDTGN